jgi:hypothetical protein
MIISQFRNLSRTPLKQKISALIINKTSFNKINLLIIIILLITSPTILSLIKLNQLQKMNLLKNFSKKMTS